MRLFFLDHEIIKQLLFMHSQRCEPQQDFFLNALFSKHRSFDIVDISAFPNDSVRICPVNLKTCMPDHINITFRSTAFEISVVVNFIIFLMLH